MIIKCAICGLMKKFDKWISMPKEIENMQHVQVIQSLCPDCAKSLEIKLLDKFKVLEFRINRLQFCETGVAVLFIIMTIVTAWCAFSHWFK